MTRVLCTNPRDPRLEGLPPRGSEDYLSALRALFTFARERLDIVCPFIDDDGVELLEYWSDTALSQVRIAVYTRKASKRLASASAERGWFLHEYRGTEGEDPNRGFHCKFFLADHCRAVVGSANLVYHNMFENVELGILIDDEAGAGTLADVVRVLRRASVRRRA